VFDRERLNGQDISIIRIVAEHDGGESTIGEGLIADPYYIWARRLSASNLTFWLLYRRASTDAFSV
jgi:hypothetical protein